MTLDPSHVIGELLAEREYVERLAQRLTGRDSHAAEDLAQEVWRAALRQPPKHGQSLRGWLRTVARNQLIEGLRRSSRTARAESQAARAEEVEGEQVLSMRGEACARLARELAQLEEPYRSVIHKRFIEGLPPRSVARSLGRPVDTIRTQTRRGLAILRERLERGGGARGREAFLAALGMRLPAAPRPAVAAPLAGVAAVGAAGGLLWFALALRHPAPTAPPDLDARLASATDSTTASASDAEPPAALIRHVADAAGRALAAPPLDAVAESPRTDRDRIEIDGAPARLRLRVHDGFAPLPGARAWLSRAADADGQRSVRALGSCGPDGLLEFEVDAQDWLGGANWNAPQRAVEVVVAHAGRATRHAVVFLDPSAGTASPALDVVVGLDLREAPLEVRVRDGSGRPIAGAQVRAQPAARTGTREELPGSTRALAVVRPVDGTTDASGHVVLEGLPAVPLRVFARAAGRELAALDVAPEQAAFAPCDLELDSAPPLEVLALDDRGAPRAGARVVLEPIDGPPYPSDWLRARTDATGRCLLAVPREVSLRARAIDDSSGQAADAVLDVPGASDRPPRWTPQWSNAPYLDVALVDLRGQPLAGLYVVGRAGRGLEPDFGAASGASDARHTDAAGHARLALGAGAASAVGVFPSRAAGAFPLLWTEDPQPQDGVLRAVLPIDLSEPSALERFASGRLRGQVADARGGERALLRHVASASVHSLPIEAASGLFEASGLPPATYAIDLIEADGSIRSGPSFELAPAADLDLGRLFDG